MSRAELDNCGSNVVGSTYSWRFKSVRADCDGSFVSWPGDCCSPAGSLPDGPQPVSKQVSSISRARSIANVFFTTNSSLTKYTFCFEPAFQLGAVCSFLIFTLFSFSKIHIFSPCLCPFILYWYYSICQYLFVLFLIFCCKIHISFFVSFHEYFF